MNDKPRMGIHMGRDDDGWWASVGRPTLTGSQSRSVTGETFWDAVKLILIPSRYYVWRYKRERAKRV